MYTKKIIREIKLIGLTKDGSKANTHQARGVVCYVDSARTCKITHDGRGGIAMETRDRRVLFTKHHKFKYYNAENNGKELRIALRKTTGKLKCFKEFPIPPMFCGQRLLAC